ncbi:MAG: bluetail domain-containing putative surface protein [Cyanobium sp.]
MDRITDLVIGSDRIDGPTPCTAANLVESGSVASLSAADIASLRTSSAFLSRRAATFTDGSGADQRTVLALNDKTAGFQSAADAVIEITGYQGTLSNLAVI